jgi:hypothetical protein
MRDDTRWPCAKGLTKNLVWLTLMISAIATAGTADTIDHSIDRWQPYEELPVLDHVTLRMHWYDNADALREAAKQSNIGASSLHGFSTLRRNTETGEYVCDVFAVKMAGTAVDASRTTTFGHEVLHCLALRHKASVPVPVPRARRDARGSTAPL